MARIMLAVVLLMSTIAVVNGALRFCSEQDELFFQEAETPATSSDSPKFAPVRPEPYKATSAADCANQCFRKGKTVCQQATYDISNGMCFFYASAEPCSETAPKKTRSGFTQGKLTLWCIGCRVEGKEYF